MKLRNAKKAASEIRTKLLEDRKSEYVKSKKADRDKLELLLKDWEERDSLDQLDRDNLEDNIKQTKNALSKNPEAMKTDEVIKKVWQSLDEDQ